MFKAFDVKVLNKFEDSFGVLIFDVLILNLAQNYFFKRTTKNGKKYKKFECSRGAKGQLVLTDGWTDGRTDLRKYQWGFMKPVTCVNLVFFHF